jgi:hypothetical protein
VPGRREAGSVEEALGSGASTSRTGCGCPRSGYPGRSAPEAGCRAATTAPVPGRRTKNLSCSGKGPLVRVRPEGGVRW